MEQSNKIFNSEPDNFSSGGEQTMSVTISAGDYKRGEVLGRVGSVYGKLTVAGSKAAAVMPHSAVFASEQVTAVFVAGNFNEDKLIIDGQDHETVKAALRDVGIFAQKWGISSSKV